MSNRQTQEELCGEKLGPRSNLYCNRSKGHAGAHAHEPEPTAPAEPVASPHVWPRQEVTGPVPSAAPNELPREALEKLVEKWEAYNPRPSTPISETQHNCAKELRAALAVPREPQPSASSMREGANDK